MQRSLDGFLAHWPLFWQRAQIADRPAYIATMTGGYATHKLCLPAARLPVSGMAGFDRSLTELVTTGNRLAGGPG
jgi:hypothetical protein